MTRLPDFIIIGAMKAATSTLHEQLARQPGLFMSTPKEPNFFSDDDQYSRGIDWYTSLFAASPPGALCGESSTHYTKLPTYPQTVRRMNDHLPRQIKFIYIMRHPIDRLISQYIHEWTQRMIDCPIDQALADHPELIEYSRYARQIEPYLEVFGRARILLVFFDRLSAHPQAELERVCRFLEYPGQPRWDERAGEENISSQRLRKSPLRDAIVNLPGLRTVRRRVVPKSWRDRVKEFWTMKQRPELSSANFERLTQIFDDDLALLGRWLALDLRCATFKSVARHTVLQWTSESKAIVA